MTDELPIIQPTLFELPNNVKTKTCIVCKNRLPLDCFYKVKKYPNQRQSRCISCNKIQIKKWRKENKDRVRKHRSDSQKRCRKHVNEYRSLWMKRNRENATPKIINNYLKRTYGITLAEYDEMFHLQDYSCAICGRSEASETERKMAFFTVDHCHKTGKVRGIICRKCNIGIGHLNDDPELLKKAVNYLLRNGELNEKT